MHNLLFLLTATDYCELLPFYFFSKNDSFVYNSVNFLYVCFMKLKFKTDELEYFYLTPLDNLAGKLPFQKEIIKQFKKKIQLLISVDSVEELRLFNSLHFEALKGNLTGEYSIRLNLQYRLIFSIEREDSVDIVIEVILINEISKHYEK